MESGGVVNTSSGHDSVMSSARPDELWSDGEEPIAMETYNNDTTQPGEGMLILSVANNQLVLHACSGNSIFLSARVWGSVWVVLVIHNHTKQISQSLITPWRCCA